MRPPLPSSSSPSSSQHHPGLETLDNSNDFISTDSSAETVSDELDEFKPPSGERKRPVPNGMERPRRLVGIRRSVDTTQQFQLRKSPRKKSLLPKSTATTQNEFLNGRKHSPVIEERTTGRATSNCNTTTTAKRTARRRARDESNSSIGSSSSALSSLSSAIGLAEAGDDPPGASSGRRGLFSSVRRGRRAGHPRGGGGRLSSLQTTASADKINDDNDASALRLSTTGRATTIGSRRRGRGGGGMARRSRGGPVTLATVAMRNDVPSETDNEQMEGKGGRAVRRQQRSRGGRRGGGGRQRRVGGHVGRGSSRTTQEGHNQTMDSSGKSSVSEKEDNERGDSPSRQLNPPSTADELSLCSSPSSSSAISSDDETEWPRGNSLSMLSPPVPLSQQRHQMPSHLPQFSAPLSRRRRKKKSYWTELQRRPLKPLAGEFDCSNPYETGPTEDMDPYQRKMQEAFILYRFLGDFSPVLRSFMHRNLYYISKQPPRENFHFPNPQNVFADDGEFVHAKSSDGHSVRPNTSNPPHFRHHPSALCRLPPMGLTRRANSRISNKIPTTIRPSFICNHFFFGQRMATVQCFLVYECNGRLSSMRNIAATFKMKVGEWIGNIRIDLPDETHNLSGDRAKSVLFNRRHLSQSFPLLLSEYLVVRVVFHFEDTEIGGRHLRKVPSRQSSGGFASVDHHQNQHQHFLRNNGPTDACDKEMYGAKRIFSYEPGGELKVINDEASISLFSNDHDLLRIEKNCLKLTAAQLGKLINGHLKSPGGSSSPFITVHLHGDSDDEEGEEEETEENEEEEQKGGEHAQNGPKLKKPKFAERRNVSREGLSLREALEAMDMAESSGRKTANGTAAAMRHDLLKLPEVIGLKFWLHSPGVSRAAVLSSAPQLPPGSPPGQQRRRLLFRTAAANANASFSFCAEERQRTADDYWEASCSSSSSKRSSSDSVLSPLSAFPPLSSPFASSPSSSVVSPPFVCRRFPSSRCFFCLASLKVRSLWALHKHLTFCHPRFEFCYEPAVPVSPTQCLPGFSISQNTKYDASNELPSVRTAVRPTWLVTKALAREMRRVDNFPIERYTAMATKQSTAEEYIRLKGRFNFETPTRIDKLWMRQMSIRKLNDISDLHPAECATMQMWNTFLLRIRITLFGRRMLYRTLRVFVKYHWHDIDSRHLRTHFLLHLTCLLNNGAIDEEERYDLYRRMDPDYDPCEDGQHIVGREMKALHMELQLYTTTTTTAQQRHFVMEKTIGGANGDNKNGIKLAGRLRRSSVGGGRMKLRHGPQNGISIGTVTAIAGRVNGTLKKTVSSVAAFASPRPSRRLSSPALPTVSSPFAAPSAGGCAHFNSYRALCDRFPFATNKRTSHLWKFLQDYDFPIAPKH
ncbi:hypothetical protein niasHS_000002 [Heterodera schachtii]|uniref:Polycomb protein VEFS-Box domain-containing protein n=1 Tax=Heterodera schachtii TaxID=97005 RepID=A0ABD2KN49_HETSC